MSPTPELLGSHNDEADSNPSELLTRVGGLLARRAPLIVGLGSVIALATIGVSLRLPNFYTSQATIFAVQQRVPERYVVPTSSADPSQALEVMVQEVLSTQRILSLIDELGLHAEERARLKPEQLIELVRRDLKVQPVERMLGKGEVNAFKITFSARSPQLAYVVAKRLTTLFIEQNLKTREDQASSTTAFLQEQLEVARKQMDVQEERLRDFKLQYLGELPEQQQGNLGILASFHSQLDSVLARRSQAQQQRLYLESLLGEYSRRGKTPHVVRSSTGEILTPTQAAENELSRLQSERQRLLTTYTPRHPEVLKKEQEIVQQQTVVAALRDRPPVSPEKHGTGEERTDVEEDVVVAQLRSQLRANTLELEDLSQKDQKLRSDITTYQSRLNLTPVREQQLASLQRDYDLVKQHYGDLLKKQQESQLATDLEKRQEGQQFRLAEPPTIPTLPSSPNRIKISLIGLVGGLAAGCVLVFASEARNTAFYRTEDITRKLAMPLVVGVPIMLTAVEQRTRSRRRVAEWITASVALTVVALAETYVYRLG
jgi:succinoglycan biosynthesis transport protein ExoP